MNHRNYTDLSQWSYYTDGEKLFSFDRSFPNDNLHVTIWYRQSPNVWAWEATRTVDGEQHDLRFDSDTDLTCFDAFHQSFNVLRQMDWLTAEPLAAENCPNCGSDNIGIENADMEPDEDNKEIHTFQCLECGFRYNLVLDFLSMNYVGEPEYL